MTASTTFFRKLSLTQTIDPLIVKKNAPCGAFFLAVKCRLTLGRVAGTYAADVILDLSDNGSQHCGVNGGMTISGVVRDGECVGDRTPRRFYADRDAVSSTRE